MSSRVTPKQNSKSAAKKKAAAKKKKAQQGFNKKVWIPVICAAALALGLILFFTLRGNSGPRYTATIEVQDYGTIEVELDHDAAPITVDNFVKLAQSGFYDGLTFHRIMKGFMIQGGDPKGNGTGGSEETIYGEFSQNGYDNPLKHTRGTISMARESGNMDSASSQFFIMHADNDSLDGAYAAFGHVTSGMEVVDAIANDAQPTDNNGTIPKDQQPVITKITITTN
ncbi:MAG: peptidylprolyl isomerase [Lachnospiraceae bacterium]|nr:peptidylprolyl isomerase [Lachnospiraceae bacterium]